MSELETSPGPINPPPPPPAIGARLFTRTRTGYGDVWAPADPSLARGMLVEVMPSVVLGDFEPVSAELVELLGDLQGLTLQSGNALEALAPEGWVYIGTVQGTKANIDLFGRGTAGIRAVALMLAEVMAAGNHPPAARQQGPVPPIVEVELPWLDHEEPIPGVRPSMMTPAAMGDDLPTVELPAPSYAAVLIAQAFASINHTTVRVDDAGFTVIWGERDLINPADKNSSDWLTDLLTHREPTPSEVKVILELVDCDNAHWERPGEHEDLRFGDRDGVLIIGEAKLHIGAELAAFGEALYQLAALPPDDDRGPVEAHADDAGMLIEADPVEVCADLLSEVLDEAHYGAGSVQVSEHDDESVVVIGRVTFRIRAPHFTGGSARVARVLGALGEALESRFLARFGETASEE